MAASKFMDTRYTNFMIERMNKEIEVKRKWYEKYYKKINDEHPPHEKSSKAQELIEKLTEQRKINLQAANKMRAYTRHPEPLPLPESDPSVNLAVMRPVSPRVRRLLYKGISHENEGRWAYLHKRYQLPPKDRYYFQETTSFGYGYYEANPDLCGGPHFGKSSAPSADFYRRNGTHRDPSQLRSPDYNNYTYMFKTL
ncbi:hypothetical protein C0J52_01608 [Blattella germanica]|nr:hypothetical protein C0J52_01608 [Blattella germanica]